MISHFTFCVQVMQLQDCFSSKNTAKPVRVMVFKDRLAFFALQCGKHDTRQQPVATPARAREHRSQRKMAAPLRVTTASVGAMRWSNFSFASTISSSGMTAGGFALHRVYLYARSLKTQSPACAQKAHFCEQNILRLAAAATNCSLHCRLGPLLCIVHLVRR